MPALRTRPGRREAAGEHVIDRHVSELGHADREARDDGVSAADDAVERLAVAVEKLRERGPHAAPRLQEPEGGANVVLLLRGEVAPSCWQAHDAPTPRVGPVRTRLDLRLTTATVAPSALLPRQDCRYLKTDGRQADPC